MPIITSVDRENRTLHITSFQDMIVESGYKLSIERPIFRIINRIVS